MFPDSVHISTQHLPPEERNLYWMQQVSDHLIQVDCPPAIISGGILASFDQSPYGLVTVNRIQADTHSVQRSRTDIENDPKHSVFLCAMLEGNGFSWQGTTCASHSPGDIVLYNTMEPYGQGFPADMEMLVVDIPMDTLEAHLGPWQGHDLVKIDRNAQVRNASCENLHTLLSRQRNRDVSQLALSEHFLDQLGTLLDARRIKSTNRPRQQLLHRCLEYIEQHLDLDELDVEHLSRAMHTSSRQLARAFELEGISVSRYIWNRRLERCREDILTSPEISISHIAFRWGFNHSAHFSRSYKQRFGETPSQTRRTQTTRSKAH